MRWRAISKGFAPALIVVDVIIRIGALLTVPRDRRPTAAMAWLMAIFLAPIPGSLLFRIFGTNKLPRALRKKQREVNGLINAATGDLEQVRRAATAPPWLKSVVELNHTLGAMPLVGGNAATLFPDYRESLAAMTEAVRTSTRYVHVEFYILTRDQTTLAFFDALRDAHRRGVVVRVLYDHLGTVRFPGFRATRQWLRDENIEFHEMLPFHPFRSQWRRPDLRNHRKLLIVDDRVAFIGSQNMIDASYNRARNVRRGLQWKDLMVRVEGPVVQEANVVFITDWYSETDQLLEEELDPRQEVPSAGLLDCQVVPSGPGFEGENNLRLFNALLYSAQQRLVIVSPYFVPDDSMLYAITTAAERGVEVQLFACEVAEQPVAYHAQRSYYETLLRSGVRIFLYRKPVVLHAKHFTVDDDVAVVGSSNMDMRSFSLNFEVSLMIHGRTFVDELRKVEDDYRRNSRELTLDEWTGRPTPLQILDNLSRLSATVQ
jgi:cardiolipin synthase A/B